VRTNLRRVRSNFGHNVYLVPSIFYDWLLSRTALILLSALAGKAMWSVVSVRRLFPLKLFKQLTFDVDFSVWENVDKKKTRSKLSDLYDFDRQLCWTLNTYLKFTPLHFLVSPELRMREHMNRKRAVCYIVENVRTTWRLARISRED